jgi:HD superfamily phosphohydrolase
VSVERKSVRVADPVQGYISLTWIERALLDIPAAQRLRYVGQSGLVHLVFPDVRTSRFIHSLGAMHLASRFLNASLEHSEPDDRDAALAAIRTAVKGVIGHVSSAEVCAKDLDQEALLTGRNLSEEDRPYVLVVEQGLRLAALFHDLGHLPFSHDFEFALEQLLPELKNKTETAELLEQQPGLDALHERVGHALTYLLFKVTFAGTGGEAARVSFEVARQILETSEAQTIDKIQDTGGAKKATESAWAWLHTLIAGELDVDRCDFVARDARNYGFESARFDLERLIDNFIVVRDPSVTNAFVPAVRMQGQAAVEAFLIARARVYQWGTRHHKVGQVAAALRYAIGEVLKPVLEDRSGDGELRTFLEDLAAILASKDDEDRVKGDELRALLARFAGYDDLWWTSVLRRTRVDDEWFRLVCWRTPGPGSSWKRVVDFPRADLKGWNIRLPGKLDTLGLGAWDDAVRGLREDGVLVVRHRFEPWKPSRTIKDDEKPESALCFYVPDKPAGERLVPVSKVSYPVDALREGWLRDLQVFAYPSSNSAISKEDVVERLLPDA